ncbi:hypothetical protein NLG97_g7341 [Lecanicillium saksenae]|uniref:Uncharacterized protein n=1 Tax=Lecanicillium saksenae TaxID=468837 RepID=A0ACC1QNR5_9HYPO|nr:hypothetical protein NLG97_g7341 [Lecanicillium saksenae]
MPAKGVTSETTTSVPGAEDRDAGSYVTDHMDAVPVQDDNATVEDPIDAEKADTDQQLEKDEEDAIDKSNIVPGRTRGAKPSEGSYREPSDKVPGVDG